MKQAAHFAVQKGWKILLTDIGINPTEALTLAGLPGDLFAREGAKITPEDYFAFWKAVEELAGEDDFPIQFGKAISGEAFDPPIFAALCSKNLNEAMRRIAQYKRLIGPLFLDVDICAKDTVIQIECYGHKGILPTTIGVTELVFFTALARLGTRKNIVPKSLKLPNPPEKLDRYDEFFGRRIEKGKKIELSFSASDAEYPFLTHNTAMWDFFEKGLKEQLSELDAKATFSDRLRSILLTMLPSGNSSIEVAANQLAISPRTLQRHLANESSSFQEILGKTRRELAQYYLVDSTILTGEISYLLGYQDTNSFLRAFKGWTGITPGQYRQTKKGAGLHA